MVTLLSLHSTGATQAAEPRSFDGKLGGGMGKQPLSILFEGRYNTNLLGDFTRERDMIGKVNDHF